MSDVKQLILTLRFPEGATHYSAESEEGGENQFSTAIRWWSVDPSNNKRYVWVDSCGWWDSSTIYKDRELIPIREAVKR